MNGLLAAAATVTLGVAWPSQARGIADGNAKVTSGPPKGALIAVGGGSLGRDIIQKFIDLAGGTDAPIVFVPTAMPGDLDENRKWPMVRTFEAFGCKDVVVLHTRDRKTADSDEFIKPLERAKGVWFGGGRQWRFVDSYLDTKTEKAFHDVLARGGVIGGSSAGATIQASYLVRGAPEGNQIMMAKGHEEGFGFLRNATIDQHVIARGRLDDLTPVIKRHPHLLGLGIDEGTAIVVRGDRMEIMGRSKVAVYDHKRFETGDKPYFFLKPGDVFNLRSRTRE